MSAAIETVTLRVGADTAFASGRKFGDVGSYRLIKGRAHFVIDPKAEQPVQITDLDLAPTDPAGLVRFSADFCLLAPAEADRGNRRLLFEFANRGSKFALRFFNDSPAGDALQGELDAGNGFLFRQGFIVAWLAWQGDLLPGDDRLLFDAPVALAGDVPVTGHVRREFIVESEGIFCQPLGGTVTTRGYPSFRTDNAGATLTRRRSPQDQRQLVPQARWRFAREDRAVHGTERAITPDSSYLYLDEGFERGWIYELVYVARDPLVLGLGYVAVGRFLAHLRKQPQSLPLLGGPIEKVYAWGHSQSSRVLRDFVYGGFNADDDGLRICDGAIVHGSGAGRMWLNHRFANGSSMAGQQFEEHHNFADRFPFGYGMTTDRLTGRADAICKRPATDPLLMQIQTSSEYWQRRASLVHTDALGEDIDPPGNVRIYHLASAQHFPPIPGETTNQEIICSNPVNDLEANFFLRALLVSLDRWATDGTLPPDSRYPKRRDETLVSYEKWCEQFPTVPGAAVPSAPNKFPLLDFGPTAAEGVLTEPPTCLIENAYPIFVPAVDADGNEIAGLRSPLLEAPSATHTGWNVRGPGQGEGWMYRFAGSAFAFATTKQARLSTADTRLSLEERYVDPDDLHRRVIEAALQLCAVGLLLAEDVDRIEMAPKAIFRLENW
jgi:hypothetical protein